jgi:hypothetical protein
LVSQELVEVPPIPGAVRLGLEGAFGHLSLFLHLLEHTRLLRLVLKALLGPLVEVIERAVLLESGSALDFFLGNKEVGALHLLDKLHISFVEVGFVLWVVLDAWGEQSH